MCASETPRVHMDLTREYAGLAAALLLSVAMMLMVITLG